MPYQQKNGKWRATKTINGKRHTSVFQTRKEAITWEVETAKQEGDSQLQKEIPSICFLDFATEYLSHAKERFCAKTWAEKRLAFKAAFSIIPPDINTNEITSSQALAVLRHVACKVSGNAANKVRKNLAAAWAWGIVYHGLPQASPWLAVQKFPADQQPRYVPPEEDFWKVYEVADSRDKVFLLFLLHTGARVGEVFRLRWDDVDFSTQRVRLGTRKTADGGMKYAWLPMTDRLADAMRSLKRKTPFAHIVFEQKIRGGNYTSRQHMMPLLCKEAGVKPFGFHAIRHLAATILAYAGVDLPTVQAILRHQSPTTTARYIKTLNIEKEKIEHAFGKEGKGKVLAFPQVKKVG